MSKGIPAVSPEKRGSCWYACYAVAFIRMMDAAPLVGRERRQHRKQSLHWAEVARETADLAVYLLTQIDKEDADG